MGWQWFGGVERFSADVAAAAHSIAWLPPIFAGPELLSVWREHRELLVNFLTVSIPMGVINVIGSLQNIESAEAGGDRFATGPSLAVNGLGSLAAGLFGSCFPTTIYIGHPGWKALGARAGYSILNGVFFTVVFLFGLGSLVAAIIPIEAGAAIVMYIGIIITAQAFQATPRAHAPAVAISLFPALAAILVVNLGIYFTFGTNGATLAAVLANVKPETQYLPGLLTLTGANSAWIIVTLVLAAVGAALIDGRYRAAAWWCGAAAVLTALGVLHAYKLDGNVIHPYFIWEQIADLRAGVPIRTLVNPSAAAQPVEGSAVVEQVVRYSAYPIALGYAIGTLLLTLAATTARAARMRSAAEYPIETT